MNALHFARPTPMPAGVADWHRLAELAAQLRDQRAERFPAMIADGRITQADADIRLRIITAIAAQWDAVLGARALPAVEDYREALGANAAEMLAELAEIATRAHARAAANPAHRAAADQAMLARALHWHQQPINHDAIHPHIWIAHDFHQWQRTQRATAARAA